MSTRSLLRLGLLCLGMLGVFGALPGGGAARAQPPIAEHYDTTRTATLKGILRGRIAVPPPTPMIIFLHVPDTKGQIETWIIAGNPMTTLRRDGWQLIGPAAALNGGEELTLTVYLPKDTRKAVQALAALAQSAPSPDGRTGPPGYIAEIEEKRARLAYGLEITKADGRKLRFGDAP